MSVSAAYSAFASQLHWMVAIPAVGCIGCVMKAQDKATPKEEKGTWMYRHKSLGLLSAMILGPRLAYRIMTPKAYNVEQIVGTKSWEHTVGKVAHYAMYGFITVMPVTGIAMGYFGGKGLPFFFTTVPGATKKNGNIAKQSFGLHKTIGTYGKFLVPLHVGGAFSHYFRGQTIFSRINPFRTTASVPKPVPKP